MGRPPLLRTKHPQESVFLLTRQPVNTTTAAATTVTTTDETRDRVVKSFVTTNHLKFETCKEQSKLRENFINQRREPPPQQRNLINPPATFVFQPSKEQLRMIQDLKRSQLQREERKRQERLEIEKVELLRQQEHIKRREKLELLRKQHQEREQKLINDLYYTPKFVAYVTLLDSSGNADKEKKSTVIRTKKSTVYLKGHQIPPQFSNNLKDDFFFHNEDENDYDPEPEELVINDFLIPWKRTTIKNPSRFRIKTRAEKSHKETLSTMMMNCESPELNSATESEEFSSSIDEVEEHGEEYECMRNNDDVMMY